MIEMQVMILLAIIFFLKGFLWGYYWKRLFHNKEGSGKE